METFEAPLLDYNNSKEKKKKKTEYLTFQKFVEILAECKSEVWNNDKIWI